MEKKQYLALCHPRSGILLAGSPERRGDHCGPGCGGQGYGLVLTAAIGDDHLYPWLFD